MNTRQEAQRQLHATLLSKESISSLPLAAAIVRVTQLGNALMKGAEEMLDDLLSQGHPFPHGHVAIYGAEAELLDAVLILISNETVPAIFVPKYNRLVEQIGMSHMRKEAA